jgi:uncharacterized protein YbcI
MHTPFAVFDAPFFTRPGHDAPAIGRSSARRLDGRVARRVAHAVGGFEHRLLGRVPSSVTVVVKDDSMVLTVCETFSPMERRLARTDEGRERLRAFHRFLFSATRDAFREHVREHTGIDLCGALAHVDADAGSIFKTFTTGADIECFLLGDALPAFGVPVDVHLHAFGADGKGPVRS